MPPDFKWLQAVFNVPNSINKKSPTRKAEGEKEQDGGTLQKPQNILLTSNIQQKGMKPP